jgi:hypothetical protein
MPTIMPAFGNKLWPLAVCWSDKLP